MAATPPRFVPLDWNREPESVQLAAIAEFEAVMKRRRTVRHFSPEPVALELIERAITVAGTAPSGAHQQPWRFVVVSDPVKKREIRLAAEAEEKENYEHRFPPEWLEALAPLGTDWRKEFLETAPFLIVVFRLDYGWNEEGQKTKHYYVPESVGIACGFLLAALHVAGLATLTHTPNPMGFLARICGRPANERAFLLIPVGYPAAGTQVPDLVRKPLEDILVLLDGLPSEASIT